MVKTITSCDARLFNLGNVFKEEFVLMRLISVLPLALLCAACNSSQTTKSAATVIPTDASQVTDCAFLRSITESQHSGLLFTGAGLNAAQDEVLASAAAIGATHVVWVSLNSGGVAQQATGSAYRCGG